RAAKHVTVQASDPLYTGHETHVRPLDSWDLGHLSGNISCVMFRDALLPLTQSSKRKYLKQCPRVRMAPLLHYTPIAKANPPAVLGRSSIALLPRSIVGGGRQRFGKINQRSGLNFQCRRTLGHLVECTTGHSSSSSSASIRMSCSVSDLRTHQRQPAI
ncbi:unnamed protein product, partial [Ectocarpus sp. 4 AP-2014]